MAPNVNAVLKSKVLDYLASYRSIDAEATGNNIDFPVRKFPFEAPPRLPRSYRTVNPKWKECFLIQHTLFDLRKPGSPLREQQRHELLIQIIGNYWASQIGVLG